MIQLRSDCLLFNMNAGDSFPCSAEVATVELIGDANWQMDPELVQHAAEAVLHYFRHELGRESVSVGEFSEALQRVLARLGLHTPLPSAQPVPPVETDLLALAKSAGKGFELAFFARLREALRLHLASSPPAVRFTGLRGSVKVLLGARRWNGACRQLSDQIVTHLRHCFEAERPPAACTLQVE